MKHLWLATMLFGGLLCPIAAISAEPLADTNPPAAEPAKSWGDPEDSEPGERGWTWFGMGYESRTNNAADATSAESGVAGRRTHGPRGIEPPVNIRSHLLRRCNRSFGGPYGRPYGPPIQPRTRRVPRIAPPDCRCQFACRLGDAECISVPGDASAGASRRPARPAGAARS